VKAMEQSRKQHGASAQHSSRYGAVAPEADDHQKGMVLEATLRAATSGGYDAVHMRSVARVAGIGTGTLYRYFPSKTHLLVAVLRREFDRLAHDCAASNQDTTPQQRIATLTERLHAEWQLDPNLTEATTRALVSADETAATTVAQTTHIIEQLFARALGGMNVTERHREIAGLITDVWIANLTAFSGHRASAAQTRERIDRGTELLLRETRSPGPSTT
jgi:AcrR family transcriptional regulator